MPVFEAFVWQLVSFTQFYVDHLFERFCEVDVDAAPEFAVFDFCIEIHEYRWQKSCHPEWDFRVVAFSDGYCFSSEEEHNIIDYNR